MAYDKFGRTLVAGESDELLVKVATKVWHGVVAKLAALAIAALILTWVALRVVGLFGHAITPLTKGLSG